MSIPSAVTGPTSRYLPPHERHPGVFAALLVLMALVVVPGAAVAAMTLFPHEDDGSGFWAFGFLMIGVPATLAVGVPVAVRSGRRSGRALHGALLGAGASVATTVLVTVAVSIWASTGWTP